MNDKMKKLLKIVATIVVVLLVVAIVVPLAFESKVGDIVKKEADKRLSAKVDFRALDLSLLRHFPHASIELKGLTVVCAAPFEGDTLAAVDRISVVVNLMSLFGDDGYEVTKVIVAEPRIHARKLADGSVNWDVMAPAADQETETPADEAAATEPEASEDASAFRLQMRDVRLKDAVLRYEDDSTKMLAAVDPLNLSLSGDLSGERSTLQLRLDARKLEYASGDVTLLNRADLEADIAIDADLKNNRYTLSDNTVRLNAITLGLDGWVALGEDRTEMDLKINSSKVGFRDILSMIPAFYLRDFDQLSADGELSLEAWAKGVLDDRQVPAFEAKLKLDNGSFKYAALPQSVTGIRIDARAANPGGTFDATTAEISTLSFSIAGNTVNGSLKVATPASDLQFDAAARGKLDLGAVKEVYPLGDSVSLGGIVTADLHVAGRMSEIEKEQYERIDASGTLAVEGVSARLSGLPEVKVQQAEMTVTPQALTLKNLAATVGRSDLAASGLLSNYIGYVMRDATLRGRLDVRSSLLDVNELAGGASAAAATEEQAGETPAESSAADTTAMQAIVVPENLDLGLSVSLKKVLFQQMELTDFSGTLTVKQGTVAMTRLAMGAFGGRVSASGSYSTAEDPQRPALSLKADISDASFSETFRQLDVVRRMVPLFEKTGGNYDMSLELQSLLTAAMTPEYSSLQASGTIRSENIHLQNITAFDRLATALKNDALRNIEARNVEISFTIRDGRIATQPFDLKMGNIVVNLSGSTGLDQTIDYTAAVQLPENLTGGVVSKVNVGIGGTFTSPEISLDVKNVVKEAVTQTVQKEVGKLLGTEASDGTSAADQLLAEAKEKGDKLIAEAEAQKEKLVEKASGKLAKALAEKSGDALISAARKEAQKLLEQAEEKIAGQQQ